MATAGLIGTGIVVVLVIGLLTAWGVRLLDRYRRRGDRYQRRDKHGVDLRRRITEPIRRDPRVVNAGILPTAMLRGDGEATVVITGQVESEEARRRVLDIARRVAPAATLVDHLEVVSRNHRKAG